MRVSEIFHGDSLKADDLKGRDVQLTVDGWALREFEEDGRSAQKIELRFAETDRTLIVNKTNATILAESYGDEIDNWVGKQLVVFPSRTQFRGSMTDCIRVRAVAAELPGVPRHRPGMMEEDQQREEHSPYRESENPF